MLKDIRSSASSLYDGGWRSEDKEQLMEEYKLSEKDTDTICKVLEELEAIERE